MGTVHCINHRTTARGTCTCVARVICGHGRDCDSACEGGEVDGAIFESLCALDEDVQRRWSWLMRGLLLAWWALLGAAAIAWAIDKASP